MKIRSRAGLAAGLRRPRCAAPAAQAAPVTVDLRIEGPTRTLFEGTRDRPTSGRSASPATRCSAPVRRHARPAAPSPQAVPTRAAAVAEASERTPFATAGTWLDSFGVELHDDRAASTWRSTRAPTGSSPSTRTTRSPSLGACADPIVERRRRAVRLRRRQRAAARAVRPGAAAARRARSPCGSTDAASNAPVSGATVGGRQTGADGRAVGRPADEPRRQRPEGDARPAPSARNRLRVCVTDGTDGACGTAVPAPPDTHRAAGGDRRHPQRPALLAPARAARAAAAPCRPTRPGCGR